jgi:hypothetical protein
MTAEGELIISEILDRIEAALALPLLRDAARRLSPDARHLPAEAQAREEIEQRIRQCEDHLGIARPGEQDE